MIADQIFEQLRDKNESKAWEERQREALEVERHREKAAQERLGQLVSANALSYIAS